MNDTQLKDLAERVERLEKVIFSKVRTNSVSHQKMQGYSGATGGMRLLVDEEFFKSKRNLGDVRKELAKRDYHYSLQAIQMALNRLSKTNGPLVAFKEGGKKIYAQRK